MKKVLLTLFATAFIAIVAVSCSVYGYKEDTENDQLTIDLIPSDGPDDTTINNDDENQMEKINYMEFIKKFWSENREILEKAAVDMREAGIDYIFNGKAFARNKDMAIKMDVNLPDSVITIIGQLEGHIKQFGWSRTPDPMFAEGENYFYFKTPRFYNEYGTEIALCLVYSGNQKETIEYEYEELSPNWFLVTLYYGE